MYKSIGLIVVSLLMSGCAHKTVHERCSDHDTLSHYRDYEQCYEAETYKQRNRKTFAQGFAQGSGWYNNSTPTTQRLSNECRVPNGNGGYAMVKCD